MTLNRYCVRLPISIAHVFALDLVEARTMATQRYGGFSDIWLDEEHAQEANEDAERQEFDAWRETVPDFKRASAKAINLAWQAWRERAMRATWLSTPRVDFEALGISLMTKAQRALSYDRWRKWTGGNDS